MNQRQRPWWALASRSSGLVTTIREENSPGERRFLIQGKPVVQGLSWLVWGPMGALVVITILTSLAVISDIKEQSLIIRALFILAFLGLPALAWVVTSIITHHLADRYLETERERATQERLIGLRSGPGELFYRAGATAEEERFPYKAIREVKVAQPIGEQSSRKSCLLLEIEGGRVILLDESLGTKAQKTDLAREIEASLKDSQL